jgi:predicted ferric reductase
MGKPRQPKRVMGNRLVKAVLIVAAFISPLVPLSFYFAGNWYSLLHGFSLGMVLGIFSFVYFSLTLIIAARIPLLDRLYGHDRVMLFHRLLAGMALGCAAGHFVFKALYSLEITMQKAFGALAFTLFGVVMVITSLVMVTGMLHRIPFLAYVRTMVLGRCRLDYSGLKLFHNATVLAALLVIVHVNLAYSTQETLSRIVVINIWSLIAIGLYSYHKIIRVIINRARAGTVIRVTPLSEDIIEIRFSDTKGALRRHRAGQFGYFRIVDDAVGFEEHPFTISSPPVSSENSITVKNLGNYTTQLSKVRAGVRLLLDGPYGIFTPLQNGHPHVFIAGGIGITPFLSIVAHRDYFEACAKRHERFTFFPVVTGERKGQTPGETRIDRRLLETAIPLSIRQKACVWFCGPEALRMSVRNHVSAMRIPLKHMMYEKFSL